MGLFLAGYLFCVVVCGVLFSQDMIPIDGCFEDGLQLWLLFSDVNCCLPPVIDGCFKDVLQQWPLFFVVDCRLPSEVMGVIDLLL